MELWKSKNDKKEMMGSTMHQKSAWKLADSAVKSVSARLQVDGH